MRTRRALCGERGALLELDKRADHGRGAGLDHGRRDADGRGGEGARIDQRGINRTVGVDHRGLIRRPSCLLRGATRTRSRPRTQRISGLVCHEGRFTQGLIDRLCTRRIRTGGQRDTTADGANDGADGSDGADHAGLEDGGLVIGLVQRGVLFSLDNVTCVHRDGVEALLLLRKKYKYSRG